MSEIEVLEEQIENIKVAYTDIVNAIDKTDEEYKQSNEILESLDNKKIDLELELENLEEQAMYDENEEQWKAEQKEQDYQYWGDQY